MLHEEPTNLIIKAFYIMNNALGFGFLEKVHENAMVIELRKAGLEVEQQRNIKVYYDGLEVGDYFADILVNKNVLLGLKACESLKEEHEAQLINYLRATSVEVGLLLNFGRKPEFK